MRHKHAASRSRVARRCLCRCTYRVRIACVSAKREPTLAERGLDFEDAAAVFDRIAVELEDRRKDCGERRILCDGLLAARLVVVGYTPRGAVRHVFSTRKANDRGHTRLAPFLGR